jgi:2-oxoisovalerate dehydrogenase E1 component
MPKNIEVLPQNVFKSGAVTFKDIPVNQYKKSLDEEKKIFSNEDLVAIYHDLCVLREFETSLNEVKTKGAYKGLEYNHAGPAHLSIGQESAAVGQSWALTVDDHLYGSHRSHSEILAKGLSAIRQLPDEELMKVMKGFLGGDTLRVIEPGHSGTVKELARKFLLYGAYAEIFARETGFNRGLGGSMHTFFIPFGILPNNAIVGGSGSLAPGAALFKRVNRKKGIVIANIGDASFACGPVWEGISFSAMDQYRTLWDKALGGGLPIMFNCMNNHYGMGGQTGGETMGYQMLARIGAGVNPDQMHAERVNGYDPLAMIDAVKRKKKILEEGGGPVLLDVVTYRVSGHSPSDASSYRSNEEIAAWQAADAIPAFRKKLVDGKIASDADLEKIKGAVGDLAFAMFKTGVDLTASPRSPMDSEMIAGYMFSNRKIEAFDDRKPELLQPLAENARVIQIKGKVRSAFENGKPVPKMKQYNLRDGLFEALAHRFSIDPTLVAFGEENRDWGGAFAVYRGLTELLPYHRLFNSPIAEAAIVGAGIGYALEGGRAVVELMYCDFMGRSGDEIFNQLSKWQSMSAGLLNMPVVLRVSVGAKYGAQHSQDWSSIINHIPGLKAVYPVTPYDAKGMLNTALAGTDPVIFFESQKLYDIGETFVESGVPEGYYEVPLNQPIVRRSGTDLTIATLGPALYTALKVADELKAKWNLSAEVVDLRTITPMDYAILVESVKKTGKLLLGTEAVERGSLMHNVGSMVTSLAFDELDAPPAVVGSRNWITPAAELEAMYFPQVEWYLDTIHERLQPLSGYAPKTKANEVELMRRYREGI